ncbi:ABC transporter ATP-binding protein [Dactylosporangium roseum]|uniref:ABC transporter ATP-binding protein n=1 Tax=Dactylosporangium roseum TaxID=47989 RepID=A0ABY5YYM9_9ACTN|nr:ABC transporter ATP-binding protein [Dactylosporangium roseum]UWZ34504.1 ABC transporter ATP-binding protein [Dactylosporangium roseum]
MSAATDVVLNVDGLRVNAADPSGAEVPIIEDVSFSLARGEVLGIVGESGSGKSLTALSLLRLTPETLHQSGSIRVAGREVMRLSQRELQRMRGNQVSMVFQDPMTGLNPVRTVGSLLVEALRRHRRMSRAQAHQSAVAALRAVGIPSPELRVKVYPHQLSGGLRQRVMIALALLHDPAVIVADEPTTALDATIQAQIIDLMRSRVSSAGLIFITHDLGVAGQICDRIIVMYAGHIVEEGVALTLLSRPRHPYTAGLLAAAPRFDRERKPLVPIPGSPPTPYSRPAGCPFAPRCARASEVCREQRPELVPGDLSTVACWHPLSS